jgi:hypothetical protein
LAALVRLLLLLIALLIAAPRRILLGSILRVFLLLWFGLLARLAWILALILLDVVCHGVSPWSAALS